MAKDFKHDRLCFDVLHKRFRHFHSNLLGKARKENETYKRKPCKCEFRSLYFSYGLAPLTVKTTAFLFSLGINATL